MSDPSSVAIFYDLDSLLRSSIPSPSTLAGLSLEPLFRRLLPDAASAAVAVHRAYANWSDPRLERVRGEVNRLAIEPVQVFALSRENKKSAADLQLAVDVVELLYRQPQLTTFVLVTGGGPFAPLARKLHAHGKKVIGTAYLSAANQQFQQACDGFIWLDEVLSEAVSAPTHAPSPSAPAQAQPSRALVLNPHNLRLIARLTRVAEPTPLSVTAKCREILAWYSADPLCRTELMRGGMSLSTFKEAIQWAVTGFQLIWLGFAKFIEFVQYLCAGTELCVVRQLRTQGALIFRSVVRDGDEVMPDLEPRDLQSAATYRSVLAKTHPIFREASTDALYTTIAWLVEHAVSGVSYRDLVAQVVAACQPLLNMQNAHWALTSLLACGMFLREPAGVPLAEQYLTLHEGFASPAAVVDWLRADARQRLLEALAEVSDELLLSVVPPFAPPSTGAPSAA